MRLYRHALESVLGMLTLADLCCALAVSREWSAAVRSMKPISASIERDEYGSTGRKDVRALPFIESIVGSPLLRHLAAVHISADRTPLDNASLGLLAQFAPNLQSLRCGLTLTPNEPLILPAKLTLHLTPDDQHTDAEINSLLRTVAALPSLSTLGLNLSAFQRESCVELGLLGACPSLTHLTLEGGDADDFILSDSQVEQIRSSLGHLRRCSVVGTNSDLLARLLQPPVTARWRVIGRVIGDARTGDLLLRLRTLTKLDIELDDATYRPDVSFLPHLPNLRVLNLDCIPGDRYLSPDALLASLLRCDGVTDLSLRCEFDSAHWSALFAKLPLKKLTIRKAKATTLRCFSAGPITQSLEELAIGGIVAFQPSELSHLYALRRLRILRLDFLFHSNLDAATLDSHSPPTPLLPALTQFHHTCLANAFQREGPSFDWMQERRTR